MFFSAYEKLIKFLFSLIIIIPITILAYYFNDTILNSYFTSDAALRFLKYLFESSLTVIIAIIGLITLFSSFNKQYFVFFSANDVLKTWSVKENIISIMNKFILITLSATIYYFVFYITQINKFTSFVLVYTFVFAIITSLFFLGEIYKLIKAIFKLVFDDKSELTLLEQMHKSIYLKNRKKYKNLTKKDKNEIEDNVDYLLNDCVGEKIRVVDVLLKTYAKPMKEPLVDEETGEVIKDTDLGDKTVRKGVVANIAGFDIKVSTHSDRTASEKKIIVGTNEAITLADQIIETQTVRDKDAIGGAYCSGLYVYGAKVVQPKALAGGTVTLA